MRYIDVDALIEKIQETVCTKCGDIYDGIKCKSCGIDDTLNFLEDAPTADVVPRDEVAKVFEEIEEIITKPFTAGFDVLSPLNQALREYNNGIRKEMLYYVAQLKEKYTKGGEQK